MDDSFQRLDRGHDNQGSGSHPKDGDDLSGMIQSRWVATVHDEAKTGETDDDDESDDDDHRV